MNEETLAEYPQEVISFAFVNQSKSNEARNYSLLSLRRQVNELINRNCVGDDRI